MTDDSRTIEEIIRFGVMPEMAYDYYRDSKSRTSAERKLQLAVFEASMDDLFRPSGSDAAMKHYEAVQWLNWPEPGHPFSFWRICEECLEVSAEGVRERLNRLLVIKGKEDENARLSSVG